MTKPAFPSPARASRSIQCGRSSSRICRSSRIKGAVRRNPAVRASRRIGDRWTPPGTRSLPARRRARKGMDGNNLRGHRRRRRRWPARQVIGYPMERSQPCQRLLPGHRGRHRGRPHARQPKAVAASAATSNADDRRIAPSCPRRLLRRLEPALVRCRSMIRRAFVPGTASASKRRHARPSGDSVFLHPADEVTRPVSDASFRSVSSIVSAEDPTGKG